MGIYCLLCAFQMFSPSMDRKWKTLEKEKKKKYTVIGTLFF